MDDLLFSESEIKPRGDLVTTSTGRPLGERFNVLTAGPRGPILLQDIEFIEELAHFDRERIPERVVHAKGAGAFGYFEVTKSDIQKYCKAAVFDRVGQRTPVAVRFSTVSGESGSADTVRDVRGFGVKFYTEEGNWDIVGNNSPIFFIRDPFHFPSFIHSQKRNPRTNLRDPDMMWDFISLRPETIHQVTLLFGDRGIPDGYRHMNGYGGHTFSLIDRNDQLTFCKFHLKTDQGIKTLTDARAAEITASNPDYGIQDLYDAIEQKKYPSWTLYVQVMSVEQANVWTHNPFDLTKVWPHSEFPLIEVGKVVLNRNPQNYFAEVEQLALSPANLVPGIEVSPDKMLHGRLFAYADTHRYRLGVNFNNLPVNRPRCPLNACTQRDGAHRADNNYGSLPNYLPNSLSKGSIAPRYRGRKQPTLSAPLVDRFESGHEDNYSQARGFWKGILEADERTRLTKNMAKSLFEAKESTQQRIVSIIDKVDPEYAEMLRASLAALRN